MYFFIFIFGIFAFVGLAVVVFKIINVFFYLKDLVYFVEKLKERGFGND